jgi:hypothetical protein
MAQCKWCGRWGLFLSVSDDGLCKTCDSVVSIEVGSRARVIKESIDLVSKGKTLETRLSRCDLIVEQAKALQRFQARCIPTLNPLPSQIVSDFQEKRSLIILDSLREEVNKAQQKAAVALGAKQKIAPLSKTLANIESKIKELGADLPSYEDGRS